MPNRFIKESIGSSESLARMTAEEERHFWRLIVQADDFGRFDARPHVVRARAYSAMLTQVGEKKSEALTAALATQEMIVLYFAEGKRYGYFPTWERHQQTRSRTSKHPDPHGDDITRYHALTHAPVSVDDDVSENVTVDGTASKARRSPPPSWTPPEWFNPITELAGYKKADHSVACGAIEEVCSAAGVEPRDVVAAYLIYWPVGRVANGWTDPTRSLLKTIDIQIRKVNGTGGSGDGRRRDAAPLSDRERFAEEARLARE